MVRQHQRSVSRAKDIRALRDASWILCLLTRASSKQIEDIPGATGVSYNHYHM